MFSPFRARRRPAFLPPRNGGAGPLTRPVEPQP